MGTLALALAARAHRKPFYVAVESYKFARMYPFSQRDVLRLVNASAASSSSSAAAAGYTAAATAQGGKKSRANTATSLKDALAKDAREEGGGDVGGAVEVAYESEIIDFTPAEYITLLLTDLGVLTPAAVSDELIRLYQ